MLEQLLTPEVLWILAGASLVMFVASLIAVPWFVARIPSDYFAGEERPPAVAFRNQPVLRLLFRLLANVLGLILIAAGIVMLVLPGQGILTIIAGLLAMSFPGKYRFEQWLVGLGPVHRSINALRRYRNQPPLQLPGEPPP